jgi:DNA processing protein
MDELTASLVLARVPGLDACTLSEWLTPFESAAAFVATPSADLNQAGVPKKAVEAIARAKREISPDLRWLERQDHHFISWRSESYPPLLNELSDPPVALYVRGSTDVLTMPQLAIVGSRNPTPHGRQTAYDFAAHLTRCGLVVTSGLALGIDTASHQGALDADGPTIAVCGTGLDVSYPKSNSSLAASIAGCGALVSEFPLGTPPTKAHFPRRNRIISGLSLGTLVVEAALQSGSLITARLAAEQGREVFAIPGSIHNPLAHGCHRLIRQGAKLVETAADIFEELRPLAGSLAAYTQSSHKPADSQPKAGELLHKGHKILLDALGFEPAGVDLLVERTGLRADEVAAMLTILELEGHIVSYPGGLYTRHVQRE